MESIEQKAAETKSARRKKTDLDGKTWTRYSISVWNDIQKTREEREFSHPAMFPAALAERLIQVFSREGDLVIDPFVGTGSTCFAARKLSRRSVGLDISEEFVKLARARLSQGELFSDSKEYTPRIFQLDARRLSEVVEPCSASLCVTSPPYWDILNQKRTADKKELRHYGNLDQDLGIIREYHRFIEELGRVFREVYLALKPGGYCCAVVMDIRKGDRFYPFHIDLVKELSSFGFVLDDIIIWDRRHEYNNLRPLGYPYVFRVNKVHEYILIFQKR